MSFTGHETTGVPLLSVLSVPPTPFRTGGSMTWKEKPVVNVRKSPLPNFSCPRVFFRVVSVYPCDTGEMNRIGPFRLFYTYPETLANTTTLWVCVFTQVLLALRGSRTGGCPRGGGWEVEGGISGCGEGK